MTRRFTPSGVDWLGDIPESWSVAPLKQRTTLVSRGRSPDYSDNEDGIPVINQACIYWDGIRYENVKWQRTSTLSGNRGRLQRGDLLMNSTGTGTLGRVAVFDRSGDYLADTHVTIIRATKDALPSFLRYVLQTGVYQGYVYSVLAPGATNQIELSREGLRRTPFPMPSVSEQRIVADFLDLKTAAIDALIARKERLVELLQEKRQAIITQAVTKGLDPNVPMKDSGVEWLGKVPAHWTVQELRHRIRRIEQGWSPSCENREADEGEWGVLKVGCVNYGRFRDSENKALPQDLTPPPELEVRPGDVLVSRANTRELVGSAAFVGSTQSRLLLCDKLFRLHYRGDTDPRFLVLLLQSGVCRFQFEREATGASGSMQNIGQDSVRRLVFGWAPLDEQQRIVAVVDERTRRLDKLRDAVGVHLDKLREYRQALITAAVTGKLDLSKEAA